MASSRMQCQLCLSSNDIAAAQSIQPFIRASRCHLRCQQTARWSGRNGGTIMQINGIHHVTAISGPARRNLDFYTRTLGLRLVKKTVNFDDPGTYHLYYGDGDAA